MAPRSYAALGSVPVAAGGPAPDLSDERHRVATAHADVHDGCRAGAGDVTACTRFHPIAPDCTRLRSAIRYIRVQCI